MRYLVAILAFLFSFHYWNPTHAQLSPNVDSIPMRDGKKLAADIYIPSGCTSCPTILIQTPYNRQSFRLWLPLNVGLDINNSDYNFVIVDWRGFYGSLGAFTANPSRGEDGYDVVDWIVQQSWSDGKVGTWGPSALGNVQYETAREQHPGHICAVPQVASPVFDYEDFYFGGVLEESYLEQLDALGYGLGSIVRSNPVDNITWAFAESNSFYPGQIDIPMLMQGGWYDHNIRQMFEYYDALQNNSPAANDIHMLVGPWVHGGTGAAYVGSSLQGELTYPGAAGWSDSLAMLFFDHHLRGIANGWSSFPRIKYFQLGENNWYDSNEWPTTDISNFNWYLGNSLELTDVEPTPGQHSFQNDPRDPSPTIGGATLHPILDQGPYDQAPVVESRSDILTFTSITLGQDVVMKGSVRVHLFFTSDRKDTDFAVRLTDVYPDGRSMLIADGIHRVRYRNGYQASDTAVITPGNTYEIDVTLPPTSYTFQAGHRIRINITSSHSRRWDINLQNGGPVLTAGDTLVATNTIYTGTGQASYVELPVVDLIGSTNDRSKPIVTLFPNPGTEQLTVSIPETWIGADLKVVDISGRTICNVVANANYLHLATSGWEKGTYFLILEKDSTRTTEVWIKQ